MRIVAERLRILRNRLNLSQGKMGPIVGLKQSSVNRYENDQSEPSCETLLRYADFFDVSLDYIFGRTDNPQGAQYEYRPKVEESDPEMKRFIEMCFDPSSPMNKRLKETLAVILKEATL